MAGDNEIYILKNFLDGNDKLNQSNLNRFYQSYFDYACDNNVYSYSYCPQDTKLDTLPYHLRELYKKFERNLILIGDNDKKVYDNWETNKETICSYLKYWIYDKLISENVTDNDFSIFFNLWNDNKRKKCSNCTCEFNIKSFSDVKKLKKTYDYSLFLKAYKKTAKINYQISNKNYCKYISEAKDIYSSFEQTCKNDYDAYCKEFNEYVLPHIKYIDPVIYEFVLENEDTEGDKDTNGDEDTEEGEDDSAISCKADSKTDPERKEGHRGAQIMPKELFAPKVIEQGDNVQIERVGEDNDQLERVEEDVPVPETPRDNAPRAQSSHYAVLSLQLGDRSAGHVLQETPPVPDRFMFSPGLDTGSEANGSPTKTIASASLVGIPSIMFLLYKFSPIRTWLDPRIRKTKSNLKNSVQGSDEAQQHDYNFDTTNMDFNRYNVGYQSR